MPPDPLTPDALRALFEAPEPLTVGLEEEVFLLDPASLDLAPVASGVLERVAGDERFKRELPAAQLELVTQPHRSVPGAIAELRGARLDVVAAAVDLARPAASAVHPFAHPVGVLNPGERYAAIEDRYAGVARRQLVCALQVHVAVGARTLPVYNALRLHLAEIAALAANGPYYAGADTGCASVRPLVCTLLPRQGLPPHIPTWEAWAEELRWGARAGALTDPATWWFELRPHVRHGTLELRVPDAQATIAEAAALAAYVHCLVALLRDVAPDHAVPPADWRLAENRWLAARHGIDAELADPDTAETRPVRDLVRGRLPQLAPYAARLGCEDELRGVEALLDANGAVRQRIAGSPEAAAKRLVDDFTR